MTMKKQDEIERLLCYYSQACVGGELGEFTERYFIRDQLFIYNDYFVMGTDLYWDTVHWRYEW